MSLNPKPVITEGPGVGGRRDRLAVGDAVEAVVALTDGMAVSVEGGAASTFGDGDWHPRPCTRLLRGRRAASKAESRADSLGTRLRPNAADPLPSSRFPGRCRLDGVVVPVVRMAVIRIGPDHLERRRPRTARGRRARPSSDRRRCLLADERRARAGLSMPGRCSDAGEAHDRTHCRKLEVGRRANRAGARRRHRSQPTGTRRPAAYASQNRLEVSGHRRRHKPRNRMCLRGSVTDRRNRRGASHPLAMSISVVRSGIPYGQLGGTTSR